MIWPEPEAVSHCSRHSSASPTLHLEQWLSPCFLRTPVWFCRAVPAAPQTAHLLQSGSCLRGAVFPCRPWMRLPHAPVGARSLPWSCVWMAIGHSGGITFQNCSFLVIIEFDHFQDHATPDPHNWLYWAAWGGHPDLVLITWVDGKLRVRWGIVLPAQSSLTFSTVCEMCFLRAC